MPTRLKRLELHGFKSFAAPACFAFEDGITAIIGPNGSGKSNIADALRWVLGEQSYTNLRGRRTEDVIFAGSSVRSPLGMAEVSVTLSNEDGELPVPFEEISVIRRAYRSGENQYLINGGRVRLKDVLQLTASLGQAHTVIGQGLVDAVLSQRAEERRGLLEHAAGISGLRLKHAEAERHLGESEQNSQRLEDLLGEIEPRLRSLERAARQARERGQVRDELQQALITLYSHQARDARARLASAEAAWESAGRAIERWETGRHELAAATAGAEAAELESSRHFREVEERAHQLREARGELEHRAALLAERRRAAEDRRLDLERAATEAAAGQAGVTDEQRTLEAGITELELELDERAAAVAELERALAAERARRQERQEALRVADRALREAERAVAAAEARRPLLDGQRADLESERARLAAGGQERAAESAELTRRLEAATAGAQSQKERVATLAGERDVLLAQLHELNAALEHGRADEQSERRRLAELEARHDALLRLEEHGAGLYAGVKAVLDGARAGELRGVVGTLASLLVVPAEFEAAVEAALGGHLQDVVVERWSDAERAIAYLKRRAAGRATFQPLDTVRGGIAARAPSGAGIRGVAAELVDADPRVQAVVAGLLGRVLVAEDLTATRAVLRALPAGWSVVTLGGEITRTSGAVTGGARVRESGMLARERELRELPVQLRDAEAKLAGARERGLGLSRQVDALRARLNEHESAIGEAREAARHASGNAERLTRQLQENEQRLRREGERAAEVDARLAAIEAERRQAAQELSRLRAELDGAVRAQEQLARAMSEQEQVSPAEATLAEARAEQRGLAERRRAAEAELARLRARREAAERQATMQRQRLGALDDELVALGEESERVGLQRVDLEREGDSADAVLGQARAALETARTATRDLRGRLAEHAEQGRALERERDRHELERSRRRDELGLLLERAARDLEVEDAEPLLARLREEDVDVPRLEGRINRLRERLRRIGLVAEDAVEQFERESERYQFLRGQLDDVRRASNALRVLMAELDRTMDEALDRTFAEVAEAFAATFVSLFGGGKARLLRSSSSGSGSGSEEGNRAGLDIVAQPPGKRLQSLALLSGGERALTAVALLFAILKVNPSPFCLLDEVDAALDEVNVVRVRDELRVLALRTQFVVVTHNRATIEGADALYGITMGDDGVSRTLSLRLTEDSYAG